MRYFTFKEPYTALIKAVDSGRAIEVYDQSVAKIEDKEAEQEVVQEMREITKEQAKVRFLEANLDENGNVISEVELLVDFEDEEVELLLVDERLVS